MTLTNTISKLPEDDTEAPKHVGAFVIYICIHLLVQINNKHIWISVRHLGTNPIYKSVKILKSTSIETPCVHCLQSDINPYQRITNFLKFRS